MIDAKKVFKAIVMSLWPGGSTTPSIGPMKDQDVVKPSANIEVLADATALAALVTLSASADELALPMNTVSITITGVGREEVIGIIK